MYITICKTDSEVEAAVAQVLHVLLCDNMRGAGWGGGGREVQEGRDMCIPTAD